MIEFCERCGEKLNPETLVVLSYDRPNDIYKEVGKSGEYEEGFVFGKACAKSVLNNRGKLKRIKGYRG